MVARSEVAWAVRNGHLIREPCSQCGALKAEAHHEDYTKPLEVVWLCRSHHKLRHAEIKRQGITIRPEPTTPRPRRKPGPKNRLNTKTALVTFSATDPQLARLKAEAERIGITIGELLRRIIDQSRLELRSQQQ